MKRAMHKILSITIVFSTICFAQLPATGYRISNLSDDFENPNWTFYYDIGLSKNDIWKTSNNRGTPETLVTFASPANGLPGQTASLQIRSIDYYDDSDPGQDDFITNPHDEIFGRHLVRDDQPSFVATIYFPAYTTMQNDWFSFGFRIEARTSELTNEYYYPSIWTLYPSSANQMYFKVRLGDGPTPDQIIQDPDYIFNNWQGGWLKLGISFDSNGVGHYFIKEGAGDFVEADEVYDTTMFPGGSNPHMEYINYNFFSLGYPADTYESPNVRIDDISVFAVAQDCNDIKEFNYKMPSDINGDCIVNIYDLNVIAQDWLDGTI